MMEKCITSMSLLGSGNIACNYEISYMHDTPKLSHNQELRP